MRESMRSNKMKEKTACIVFGAIATAGVKIFGGWTPTLNVVLIMMGIDMLLGTAVAFFYSNSPKTESGAASSGAMLKGIVKKFGMVCVIAASHQIDVALGVNYVMLATVYGFIANEALSIIENAGLMGIVKSDLLMNAIEILKNKSNKAE